MKIGVPDFAYPGGGGGRGWWGGGGLISFS